MNDTFFIVTWHGKSARDGIGIIVKRGTAISSLQETYINQTLSFEDNVQALQRQSCQIDFICFKLLQRKKETFLSARFNNEEPI